MFNFIAELFGKMFGTSSSVEKLIEKTSSGLDKLIYTEQEKAEDISKSVSEARSMVIDWMRTTSGQNIARRFIALIITITWLAGYASVMILSVAAIWIGPADKLIESATVIRQGSESMNGAMMLILGFYFATPYLGDIAKSALQKFGGK